MQPARRSSLIASGDCVVFDENGERASFMKVVPVGKLRVGKMQVSLAQFIGVPWGAMYQLTNDGKGVERIAKCPQGEWAVGQVANTTRNNAGLFDRNEENQKLTQRDIEAMRSQGLAGHEIVQALCSNSVTFQNKTEFSQEKYKRKKARKYVMVLTLQRPTARTLCQAYYSKGPERVHNLRPDSLAMMLSLGNVAAGSKVLVMDSCVGVVAAAVVERLGGMGAVCCAYVDKPVSLAAAQCLNLSPAQSSTLSSAALHMLSQLKVCVSALPLASPEQANSANAPGPSPSSGTPPASSAAVGSGAAAMTGSVIDAKDVVMVAAGSPGLGEGQPGLGAPQPAAPHGLPPDCMEASSGSSPPHATTAQCGQSAAAEQTVGSTAATGHEASTASEAAGGNGTAAPTPTESAAAGMEAGAAAVVAAAGAALLSGPKSQQLHQLVHPGFDSAVLAAPLLQPAALMQAVLPLLAPSAHFVLFSPWPQPLAECLAQLQASKQAVLLELQESWLRPYQVLPSRTHPTMSCAGTGGYLLSGIKLAAPGTGPGGGGSTATVEANGSSAHKAKEGGHYKKRGRDSVA
ncbi:Gcd10p family-domain-containing protein [Haematococcus lacustris]